MDPMDPNNLLNAHATPIGMHTNECVHGHTHGLVYVPAKWEWYRVFCPYFAPNNLRPNGIQPGAICPSATHPLSACVAKSSFAPVRATPNHLITHSQWLRTALQPGYVPFLQFFTIFCLSYFVRVFTQPNCSTGRITGGCTFNILGPISHHYCVNDFVNFT